jgi:hypothetical protein
MPDAASGPTGDDRMTEVAAIVARGQGRGKIEKEKRKTEDNAPSVLSPADPR